MRKLALIAILLCGLLFAADGGRSYEPEMKSSSALSVSQPTSGEWLCEHIFNSDLNTTRLIEGSVSGGVMLPTSSAVQFSSVANRMHYAAFHSATLHSLGLLYPMILRAVTRTSDFYILRLRRLII